MTEPSSPAKVHAKTMNSARTATVANAQNVMAEAIGKESLSRAIRHTIPRDLGKWKTTMNIMNAPSAMAKAISTG